MSYFDQTDFVQTKNSTQMNQQYSMSLLVLIEMIKKPWQCRYGGDYSSTDEMENIFQLLQLKNGQQIDITRLLLLLDGRVTWPIAISATKGPS